MKALTFLFATVLALVALSCNKAKDKPEEEQQQVINPVETPDPLKAFEGTYQCLVKNTYYSPDTTSKDTSYITSVNVKKIGDKEHLVVTIDGANPIEVTMYDTQFHAPRFTGYFYGPDSLFINNSHPTGIYTSYYRGKKQNQ